MKRPLGRSVGRFVLLVVVCFVALQIAFIAQIAAMLAIDPLSTTFQRSEAWRLALAPRAPAWQQRWLDYAAISAHAKRAVIASEDAGFSEHSGIEWDALEKAWERNQRAEATVERTQDRATGEAPRRGRPAADTKQARAPKVVGGSTITQQLAKNLFLAGERNFVRKGQELFLAYVMEAVLGKRRILELYLNSVEWGEGVFGVDAAARRYFRVGAGSLSAQQAAQLAVMLPAPKRFEKRPGSGYVLGRAATIVGRMGAVDIP
ncbi:MAG TPA: transglycosylase domain-containing protein [Caldimonas sp.]|jgi:monofunctional biosynthetic peptidoglycan transglycosylase|nr:transglycosylase domain-containing protein [Caldimonas sp.]HEX2540872.1 transglycosylase domain-containing protein [Caldimonas sp.]